MSGYEKHNTLGSEEKILEIEKAVWCAMFVSQAIGPFYSVSPTVTDKSYEHFLNIPSFWCHPIYIQTELFSKMVLYHITF